MRTALPTLFAVLALPLAACSPEGSPAPSAPPIAVQTAMPVRRSFPVETAAFGQLGADSRRALSLGLPQAGLVTATLARPGQRVTRGERLLEMRTDPAARSAYLQARSAVAIAHDDLARTQRLHADKLATNAQLDAARKALGDAQAGLAAQAALGGANAVASLAAPADGVVTAIDVQPGQRVAAGARLIEFSPGAALVARLGVEPARAAAIHTGDPVAITPVYGVRGARPLQGAIAMVGAAVDPATELVEVVATFAKPAALPAGTAVSARIITGHVTAWAVPRNALQDDAQGNYIFQVVAARAARVPVTVLAPDGSPIGVAGALTPNAPVITVGSYEIANGDAVQRAPAGGSRAHGAAVP